MPYDPGCSYAGCGGTGTNWNGRRVVRCPQCGEGDPVTADDPRLARARGAHASAHGHDEAARQRRDIRDRIVRELRAEDPKRWTLSALAAEVGCSKELIAHILRQDRDDDAADGLLPDGSRAA